MTSAKGQALPFVTATNLMAIIRWTLLLVILLARPSISFAQQSDSSDVSIQNSTSEMDRDNSNSTDTNATDSGQSNLPNPGVMSTLDTSNQMPNRGTSRVSPLQWGHLYLSSFDAFFAFDSNFKFASTDPQSTEAGAARVVFVYAVGNEHEGLNIEYSPFILLSPNEQEIDFDSTQVNLRTFRRLSSRWTVSAFDQMSYTPDRGSFIDATVTPNFATGGIAQSSFLANGSKELRESAVGFMAYRIAEHDTIGLHAQYEFVNLSEKFDLPNSTRDGNQSQNVVGGGIGWSHEFSPYVNAGLTYNYDIEYVGNLAGHSQSHSLLLAYSQRIRPTFSIEVAAGPAIQIRNQGAGSYSTVRGSVAVLKTFHNARLAGLYSRDYNYAGVISDSYHDRFDVDYSRNFGPRWSLSGGGGYLINNSTFAPQVQGRDIWARASHQLNPGWSIFASFANSGEEGGRRPYGRNSIVAGVHWSHSPE